MPWDVECFTQRLTQAVRDFDTAAVGDLVYELTDHLQVRADPYPREQAERVLNQLRCGRFFSQLEKVADRFIQTGQGSTGIRLQYAQSLLDQDRLAAAERFLLALRDEESDPDLKREIAGLLGRAYKQMYLNLRAANNPRRDALLRKAFQCYFDAYRDTPETNLWHGINALALCVRGGSAEVASHVDPDRLAREILAAVEVRRAAGSATAWDEATAAEACISLGHSDEAIKWVFRLISHSEISAFHLGSFERQLRTMWGLTPTAPPGEYLLRLVQGELLKREGGQVDVEPQELDAGPSSDGDSYLQRILGNVGAQTYQWMLRAIERGRAVARITLLDGRPVGSGFAIPANRLCANWEGVVLMTNAHVVSPDSDRFPRPQDIVVTFESGQDISQTAAYTIEKQDVLWSSPPGRLGEPDMHHLDVTLVRLPAHGGIVAADQIHDELPRLGAAERIYVIGHPQGRALSFSIQDNKLLDYESPLIHYHTPTEPGSSGSPLFDGAWRVIGVHHAGGDRSPRLNGRSGLYPANEGVSIKAVRQMLNEESGRV
ncbi:MAG: serine protease [Gammaproteobacteria bacterium]|nr:serine protease [Gammaproteobacteria bacterium]